MPGLVRIDLEPVAARLRAVLPAFGVAGAYIFGSALDEARPDSDIDVGLIRFRHLAAAGAFPEPLREDSAMVGFRHLAVHGYEVFDDRELSRVPATDLGDFESLLDSLVAYAARS